MKNWKKALLLVLAAAALLSLNACGSFTSRMTKAVKKMNAVENYHMNMDLPLSMSISLLGKDINMDMRMGWELDVQKEPLLARGEVAVFALGLEEQIPCYVEKDGESYKMYTKSLGRWNEETLEAGSSGLQMNLSSGMTLFLSIAGTFREAGTEIVSGSEATRFDGEIRDEYVALALNLSGAADMLTDMLRTELSEEALSQLGSIPTSIWIDDASGLVVRYDMDMSQIVRNLSGDLLEGVKKEYGLEGLDVKLTVASLKASVVLSDFDKIGEIVLPAEVRAAS